MSKKLIDRILCITIIFVIILFIGLAGYDFRKGKFNNDVEVATDYKELPKVGSYSEFKKLMKEAQDNYRINWYSRDLGMRSDAVMEKSSPQGDTSTNYSKTNVQVDGVDEADVVKTDGEYIYKSSNGYIDIIKAYPAEVAEVVNKIKVAENSGAAIDGKEIYYYGYPSEIYVDGDFLVAIVNGHIRYMGETKVIVYNIKDKKNVKKVKEFSVEGNYVSSRKIDKTLYLVSNRYIDIARVTDGEIKDQPKYKDSAAGTEKTIDYSEIRYFPGCIEPGYIMVSSLQIDEPKKEAKVSAYIGSGSSIYMSKDSLYISAVNYKKVDGPKNTIENKDGTVASDSIAFMPYFMENNTLIYKFKLKDSEAVYTAKAEVPGRILNQFSMDENNNYFRIATTRYRQVNERFIEDNNLYVLNDTMKLTGKIEGIAEGEQIYSVRFMGDRAYMVTFKTVDPLFVIDLSNTSAPKILGKLKIPGYSTYLHPYDENHIIGFGKDTIEMEIKDFEGKTSAPMAFYQGLKMALFDVTDVNNPVEEFKVIIGDRGTDSELIYNHKALLFSKEKNVIAFPVTLMEIDENKNKLNGWGPDYGTLKYQGAYIYSLDMEKGFQLKGKITHLNKDDYLKAGEYYGAPYEKCVNRILYIGDNLYTISQNKIKINDINSLTEIKDVDF